MLGIAGSLLIGTSGSNEVFHIDSITNVSSVSGPGSAITSVGDQTGYHRNVTATSPNRPPYDGNKFSNGTLNGINFEIPTSVDRLSAPSKIHTSSGFTAFIVFQFDPETTPSTTVTTTGNVPLTILSSQTNAILAFGLSGTGTGEVSYSYSSNGGGSFSAFTSSGLVLCDGNTHTIAVTHNALTGNIIVYADGVQVATGNKTFDSSNSGFDTIGLGNSFTDTYWGDVAEIRVFSAALSKSSISSLHAGAVTQWFDTTFNPIDVGGLIAWWNANSVTTVNAGANVGSWAPNQGSAVGDTTYTLTNSDGTFATVPKYFTGGVTGWSTVVLGTTQGTDEFRKLDNNATGPFTGSGIAQPATWFHTFMLGSFTSNDYLRLSVSGSQTDCHSLLVDTSQNLQANDSFSTGMLVSGLSLNTPYVCCAEYSATTGACGIYLNNSTTALATGTSNGDFCTSLSTGTFDSGETAQYWQSDILVYSGLLGATNRTNIMQYLATRRNISGFSP